MSDLSDEPKNQPKSLTYNVVATKLLQDKFFLTALELHTELVESGRELRQLKDFFSNPGNFELQIQESFSSRISRSNSQATLDSLDLTRFSEDGAGTDERVAVLEFELRKAKETINALRNNLTVATESETSTPDKGSLRNINVGSIKPHEQRALNFLINEYLLLHSYKLTSITFADENQCQDFDDWDDVGLNISKPPELLTLYREGLKQTGQNCLSVATQTEFDVRKSEENDKKIQLMDAESEELKLKIKQLESSLAETKSLNLNLQKDNELLSSQIANDFNVHKTKDSLDSESPERFEIIVKKRDSIITIEDNISNNSFNDWTNVSLPQEKLDKPKEKLTDLEFSKDLFRQQVFALCYINLPQKVDNEILDRTLSHSITTENLIQVLSHSLPKIIPNIILNKREDVIPLLISAVHLNPVSSERDKLLQQLFNLKKKPSEPERMMILTGIVGIARISGENLVENEILPQCWEQLTHKHVERRLLVTEACTVLIPYVSSSIRNSLILSILQQMLEDREEIVRETAVKALSLVVALCDDFDKYNQCEELALNTLNDAAIIDLSTLVLFPVVGKWALSTGRLRSNLLKSLLHKLNNYLKDTEISKINQSSEKILKIVNVLENLLPFLLMSVVCQDCVLSNIEADMAIEMRADFVKLCTSLTNPSIFNQTDINVGMILYEFDKYIDVHREASWPGLDWVLDMLIPDLLNNLNHLEINQNALLQSFVNLFSHICILFGKSFTKFKIRPIFETQIQSLEQILSSFNQFSPSLNIIPVYLVSVLSYCDDNEEVVDVLKRFLCALPLCGTPLDCLEITVKRLCELGLQDLVVACLWEGVVHQRPLVRSASAALFSSIVSLCDHGLLKARVTPALVTLASDSDVLVRSAAIPALGSLITDCNVKEIHDKAYMQIQSYIADASLRDNHTLLHQLIVTLGCIVNSCTPQFQQEVILPQLASLSSYMQQMSNQTRKVDMAVALVEAYTNVVYGASNKQKISTLVLSGLKCLESVVLENHSLISHKDTVLLLIKECDKEGFVITPPVERSNNKLSQNVNQGVEEMRQRVSKMFNKPTSSKPNLQAIFKKK